MIDRASWYVLTMVITFNFTQAPEAHTTKLSDIVMWNDNRRLQTQILPIGQDTVSIRSLDWDRDRFDIEFGWVLSWGAWLHAAWHAKPMHTLQHCDAAVSGHSHSNTSCQLTSSLHGDLQQPSLNRRPTC